MIDRGAGVPLPGEEFAGLARDVFRFQYEHIPIYRGFCDARGVSPETVRGWLEIPAVPTDAFRAAPLTCADPEQAAVVFRTSGTTAGAERRGAHHLHSTKLYRAALLAGFRHALLPDRERIRVLSMIAPHSEVGDSSLSFMVEEVIGAFGAAESEYFVSRDGVQTASLISTLDAVVGGTEPILLLGTSLVFAHLLESYPGELRLPAGSRAMDTGGFKARRREISRRELRRLIVERLGLDPEYVINEYGMTEMSSQLYDGRVGEAAPGARRLHRGPGWLRSVAVDPESLQPLPSGEAGILRHLDLANLYSVAALQTADVGRVHPEGIELMGRSTGAPPRGCSLAMEELLEIVENG